jgi:Leucine-rich repeat (LRR) protein
VHGFSVYSSSRSFEIGMFPDVSKLVYLEVLNLDDNHLTGTLPGAIISKLQRLEILSLQHNVFHGDLPMQMLGELDHLREIWLTNNHFSGENSVFMGFL